MMEFYLYRFTEKIEAKKKPRKLTFDNLIQPKKIKAT